MSERTTATGLMTADEFFEWCHRPENRDRHYELEQGRAVEVSRPGELHGVICGNVVWVLGNYVRQRRKGHVCANDTGIIWENDPAIVRGPDVSFFDGPRRLDELHPKYTEEVPRLAVEVVSPNDRMPKLTRRISQFLKWGVPVVWLLDPEDRCLTVFRPDHAPEVLDSEQELTGGDALPEFRCRVSDFFFMPEGEAPPAPLP